MYSADNFYMGEFLINIDSIIALVILSSFWRVIILMTPHHNRFYQYAISGNHCLMTHCHTVPSVASHCINGSSWLPAWFSMTFIMVQFPLGVRAQNDFGQPSTVIIHCQQWRIQSKPPPSSFMAFSQSIMTYAWFHSWAWLSANNFIYTCVYGLASLCIWWV